MRFLFFSILVFYVGLLYSQTTLDDYNHFTPERQHVLSKMGEFFDETIRKNFPAETDTLSYYNFIMCVITSEGFDRVILNIDRNRLKEINQMLFEDHIYYFFYARYIYTVRRRGEPLTIEPTSDIIDTIPTIRTSGPYPSNFGYYPVLNYAGYINVVPDNNPAIKCVKEDMAAAGELSLIIFMSNVMFINVREVSQPVVKELCAVVFWRYLCICAGVDLIERKPFCEPCDL